MSEGLLAAVVDALLDELIGSEAEVGLQLAVIRNGRTLVDAARGQTDLVTGVAVDRDTLFWAGSAAKGVATSVAHVLSNGEISATTCESSRSGQSSEPTERTR